MSISICRLFVVGACAAFFITATSAQAQTVMFQDESGQLHFVEKLSQVPEKFREQVMPPTPAVAADSPQFLKQKRELEKAAKLKEKQQEKEKTKKEREQKKIDVKREKQRERERRTRMKDIETDQKEAERRNTYLERRAKRDAEKAAEEKARLLKKKKKYAN